MKMRSLKLRRGVAVMTLALAGFTSPVFAGGVSDCYWDVIKECNDALRGAKLIERVAIGVICTGMLAGCGFESL